MEASKNDEVIKDTLKAEIAKVLNERSRGRVLGRQPKPSHQRSKFCKVAIKFSHSVFRKKGLGHKDDLIKA
jgi:hypothetical protein